MNPPLPEFSISILTYTALPMAKRCIESVLAAGGNIELLLTDNGGAPEVGKFFDECAAKNPERVHVTHNATNLGFIEPNRQAFRIARGKYFILLNDDTLVQKGWLDLLKAPFAADAKCAMTGPTGGCTQLRPDFHGEMGPRFEYLEGAMLCMDRELVAAIEPNLFPPELDGAYGEDSYISLRVREAGFNIHRVALQYTHYRCTTSAMVPQCREWQMKNHAFLQQRFRRYMMHHSFAYPTIVKRAAAWGDVLLTTPIIRALKKLRPMSPIWVETACPDVFNNNPDVAHVSRTAIPQPVAHVMVNLNGISEMNPSKPILQAYADCAEVELDGEMTALFPLQGDVEWAKRTVPGEGWIAIHPGPTSWRCKNWPFERWVEVITSLRAESHKVMLVGNDRVPQMTADLDLCGQTTVAQLAAVLSIVKVFAGVDSFPIHVAQAMRTPVVGLFGITTAANILTNGSPWVACESYPEHPATGLRHRVVGRNHVDHPNNPMETIEVANVLLGIRHQLVTAISNE
jgi:ADP-heptose:LPS heptosyltransferase/glycosyltransferase involved in cell wall biosynthesis